VPGVRTGASAQRELSSGAGADVFSGVSTRLDSTKTSEQIQCDVSSYERVPLFAKMPGEPQLTAGAEPAREFPEKVQVRRKYYLTEEILLELPPYRPVPGE